MGKALVGLLIALSFTVGAEVGSTENQLQKEQTLIATPTCASTGNCTHGEASCREGPCGDWKLSQKEIMDWSNEHHPVS